MLSFIFAITSMFNPTPCRYEDGSEMLGTDQSVCIWDASDSGNNEGESFIVFKSEQDTLIYLYQDGTLVDAYAEYAQDTPLFEFGGFTRGEIIVCEEGLEPVTDVTPDGIVWAACM